MGEAKHHIPQTRIADALEEILALIDPDGQTTVDGYQLPQKRIAEMLTRLAKRIDDDGGIYAKVPTHICTSSEYDHETGKPTVKKPEKDTFYLVPDETLGGDDMYVEWIYTGKKWERFGSGGTLASYLKGLSDVHIAAPVDGQTLVYDAELDKWVNSTSSGGKTYEFAEGDVDGAFSVTADGEEQSVKIHGLRSFCFGNDDEGEEDEIIFDSNP